MTTDKQTESSSDKQAELQLQRLDAEIAKLRAEEDEIRLRTKEARDKQQLKWWLKPTFLQILATALTGIAFLSFYITYSVIPAFKIENLELKLENLTTKETLIKEKETLMKEQEELKKQNSILIKDLNNVKQLNAQTVAAFQQAGREKEAGEAQNNAQRIQSTINQLDSRTQSTGDKAIIYIQIPSDSVKSKAESLRKELNNNGFNTPGMQVVGKDISPDNSQVRYFYKEQEDGARQLLVLLNKLEFKDFELKYIKGFEGKASREVLEIWFSKSS